MCKPTAITAIDHAQVLPYEPVPCKQCGAVLNPYASVDYYGKMWICPFCYTRNHFPVHYHGISEQNVPAELYPQYTTIEYTMSRSVPLHPPVYLFVVDTCLAEDELQACKSAVTQVRGGAWGLHGPCCGCGVSSGGRAVAGAAWVTLCGLRKQRGNNIGDPTRGGGVEEHDRQGHQVMGVLAAGGPVSIAADARAGR